MKHTCLSCVPLGKTSRLQWVTDVANKIRQAFVNKYLDGEQEHGSDLGDVSTLVLLQEAKAESLDQLAYLHELERRLMTAEGFVVIDRMTLARLMQGCQSGNISLDQTRMIGLAVEKATELLEQQV